MRGVFAEAVAGRQIRRAPERAERRHRHRQGRRLGVLGELQALVRPFETERRDRFAERFIGLGEGLAGGGEPFDEIPPHAREL